MCQDAQHVGHVEAVLRQTLGRPCARALEKIELSGFLTELAHVMQAMCFMINLTKNKLMATVISLAKERSTYVVQQDNLEIPSTEVVWFQALPTTNA